MVSGSFKRVTFELISWCVAQFLTGPGWYWSAGWRLGIPGLKDLWDYIKNNNTYTIGTPKGEKREQGIENQFEEITTKNIPNLVKEKQSPGSTESLK